MAVVMQKSILWNRP